MLETSRSELKKLEVEYKLWISAFLDLHPGRPSDAAHLIKEQIAKNLKLETSQAPADYVPSADAVTKWATRASIPKSAITREALSRVIKECVPNAPRGLRTPFTFPELLSKLDELRSLLRDREIRLEEDDFLFESGVLRVPVSSAKELDLQTLGLGSFLFDGEAPPYVERSAEAELVDHLRPQNHFLIAIEGPPKSGKTRLLVEAISKSELGNFKIYWLSNVDGAIGTFLKKVGVRSGRRKIIVLDDLQTFGTSLNPQSLNSHTLSELAKRGIVVATRLSQNVLQKKQLGVNVDSSFDRASSGPSFLSLENSKTVKLETVLDQSEREKALALLSPEFSEKQDIKLGVILSSGDVLLNRFIEFGEQNRITECARDSILNCHLLFSRGFSIGTLRAIAKRRLLEIAPNAAWSDLMFEEAALQLTDGVSPGSPHAILTRISENGDTYKLFDYIWSELNLEDVSLINVKGIDVNLNEAAKNSWNLGFKVAAQELNQQRLEEEPFDDVALSISARFHLWNYEYEDGKRVAAKALEINPLSHHNYIVLSDSLWLSEDLNGAADSLRAGLSKLPGNYELSIKLAPMLVALGQATEALTLIESLAESSFPSRSDYFVAMSAAQANAGNLEAAVHFAREGLKLRTETCGLTQNLEFALRKLGKDSDSFKELQNHLSECGQPCESNLLYLDVLIDRGDLETVEEEIRRRKNWRTNPGLTAGVMGRIAGKRKDFEEAKRLFALNIADTGNVSSFGNLMEILLLEERRKEAQEIGLKGIRHYPQSGDLMNLMGNALLEDDENQAAYWYERATLTSSPSYEPFWNLARIRWRSGDTDDALLLYQQGFELGGNSLDEYDLFLLSDLYWNVGDYAQCAEFSRERFERHHSRQALETLLDCLTFEQRISYLESLPTELSQIFWVKLAYATQMRFTGDDHHLLALTLLEKTLKKYPDNLELIFTIGLLNLEMGVIDSAHNWFDKAQGLVDTIGLAPIVAFNFSATAISLGNLKRTKSLDADLRNQFSGSDADFSLRWAWALADAQNYEISQVVTDEGIRIDPKDVRLLNHRATLYLQRGNTKDAIAIFRKSLEIDSTRDNPFAAIELVRALIESGEQEKALEFGTNYLKKLPVQLTPSAHLDLTELLLTANQKSDSVRPPRKRQPRGETGSLKEAINKVKKDPIGPVRSVKR